MAPSSTVSLAEEALRRSSLPSAAIGSLVFGAVVAGLAYAVAVAIYRVTLHPLAKVPGPKLWAISYIPFHWHSNVQGTWVRHMVGLHAQYGPIVRVGPNHVAYDGNVAWPEAYVQRKDKAEFGKIKGFFSPDDHLHVLGALDSHTHRHRRRILGPGFSDKSLQEQESLIMPYIDMFLEVVGRNASSKDSPPLDIPRYLNFTTFDIIGDLVYQDTFGCLRDNDYHPWVDMLFNGIRSQARFRIIKAFSVLRPVASLVMLAMKKDFESMAATQNMAFEKAKARMALGETPNGRNDLMTAMLRPGTGEKFGAKLTPEEVIAHSPLLVAAGSETTATGLSGMFFYMGKHPAAYSALAHEIRSAFNSADEINMVSTYGLPYLKALIEESLRMFPPAADLPPRLTPQGGGEVGGVYLPEGTMIQIVPYATFRNPAHFVDPDSFHPERFLPKDHPLYDQRFANDDLQTLRPFSYGQRDCIGKNLAYAEMRVIMAKFIFLYDYELLPGQDDWMDRMRCFLVWEKDSLNIKVTPARAV